MLTEHFSEHELGVEDCEQRLKDNAAYLCRTVLEPIHSRFGLGVRVHDGYRDDSHNKRVGGKPTSYHLFEDGKAAADVDVPTLDLRFLFDWLRLNSGLQFDKVILESKHGTPQCIHIQVDMVHPPRRQAFTGDTGNGSVYTQVECK